MFCVLFCVCSTFKSMEEASTFHMANRIFFCVQGLEERFLSYLEKWEESVAFRLGFTAKE